MCLHCILSEGKKTFGFTSLEHHKIRKEVGGGGGEEAEEVEEGECQTPFEVCEVIFSLVESSGLVDRLFLILLSNSCMKFSLYSQNTKNKIQEALCHVLSHRESLLCPAEMWKRS